MNHCIKTGSCANKYAIPLLLKNTGVGIFYVDILRAISFFMPEQMRTDILKFYLNLYMIKQGQRNLKAGTSDHKIPIKSLSEASWLSLSLYHLGSLSQSEPSFIRKGPGKCDELSRITSIVQGKQYSKYNKNQNGGKITEKANGLVNTNFSTVGNKNLKSSQIFS